MNANLLQEKLSSWQPGEGRHSHSFELGNATAIVVAEQNSPIAALVWELTVARTAEAKSLKNWADGIVASASGLQEDLKVIEIDPTRNEALLRSDAPSRKGPLASYYEVVLHGPAKAVVRRYQADTQEGTRRVQVATAITHETLAKLAEDIAA